MTQHIILGDFNDDPNDADHSNVFLDTFLADPDFYDFTAVDLAPSSVTSTGWYHYVGGEKVKGQFIDHILLTQPITDAWDRGSPTIHGVAEEDFEAWIAYSSDHFPVRLELTPAP